MIMIINYKMYTRNVQMQIYKCMQQIWIITQHFEYTVLL